MFRANENKKWSGISVAIIVCLAIVGVAQADWQEQDKLLASDGAFDDQFGWSVSVSGDYAIVGAEGDDGQGSWSGSAYIFTPNDVDPNNWDQQTKLTASYGAAYDYFGVSVSISGDYAIVGAFLDDDNGTASGSAYIFTPNDVDPNNWDQQAKLVASDGADLDFFGAFVSISGDYAMVGAQGDDDDGWHSGSAYIFKRDGESWIEQAKLTASDAAAGDHFGRSVSIGGDYAIVGAFLDDDNGTASGSAYIFTPNDVDPNNWDQQQKLTASDADAGDIFGRFVSISGDYAIVGAHHDDDNGYNSGSAYIFKRDGLTWTQQAKLTASDGAAGDAFAISVSISGDYAIVGATGDNDNGTNSGSAYIFTPNDVDPNNWDQQQKLTASDAAAHDLFGRSVSISGDYAIVGAHGDDDNGSDSGSAYIFALKAPLMVGIDIKPGSYPNAINPGSHGLVPVAILSDEDFDATSVDPETVELAGAGVEVRGKGNKFMAHEEDVNGDELLDLVVQVATANLEPNSLQDGWAILTAKTSDSQDIQGKDEITIVPTEE